MGQNIANSPYKEFILFDKEVIFFYILIPEKKKKTRTTYLVSSHFLLFHHHPNGRPFIVGSWKQVSANCSWMVKIVFDFPPLRVNE